MIEVSKQYSVLELLRELNISNDMIRHMKMYGKTATDIVITELLCDGYEFLYCDTEDKCFLILEKPIYPQKVYYEFEAGERTPSKWWCGPAFAGEPILLRDKTEDGKWILSYESGKHIYYFCVPDWLDSESYYENFDEFTDNFEEYQADLFKEWFYENEYDNLLREGVI